MTNILALPELLIPCTIRTNDDWLDSVSYADVNGNPVALDGIDFELQARATADSGDVLLDASTDNGLLTLCAAAALVLPVNPGAGFAIGDQIGLAGGAVIVPAVLIVNALALVGALEASAGSGHAVGDVLTLGGGVFSVPAKVRVDAIGTNGAIAAFHVLAGGSYTVAPAALPQSSSTGAGVGASFATPVWGVAAATMTSAGTYSALPANPVSQGTTTGLGSGFSCALSWVNNALCIAVPISAITDYLIAAATTYEIRAIADGYTQVVVTGPLTVEQGVVR